MSLFSTRYFLFALLLLLAACSREPSITGEWKLAQLRPLGQMLSSTVSINLSRPDSTKMQLRSMLQQRFPEAGGPAMESKLDAILAFADKAGLRLSSNREFGMDSYGLIVPKAVPGWNFGDRLLGIWDLKNDTLSLSVGEEELGYTFHFLVLAKTRDTLRLWELQGEDMTPGTEITFSRKQ